MHCTIIIMCMSIFQSATVITIAIITLSYLTANIALEASSSKISTLPAKIRRLAISVTAKKTCWRQAENPKVTESELSQLFRIALLY